jgi:hypothetical protein
MWTIYSSDSQDELVVFHGTNKDDVHKIKNGIHQPLHNRGDFHTGNQPAAFYTTTSQTCAELYIHHKRDFVAHVAKIPKDTIAVSVMKFKLHLHGLNVYNFGNDLSGEKYKLWQKVT